MTLPAQLPRDDSKDKVLLDVYMAPGQHYQAILTRIEAHEIYSYWKAVLRGDGKTHLIGMHDRLGSGAVQFRLAYVSSMTLNTAPPEEPSDTYTYH